MLKDLSDKLKSFLFRPHKAVYVHSAGHPCDAQFYSK
nr:MAG TPA: hypothetical protein [Caudoviricetes sp.]